MEANLRTVLRYAVYAILVLALGACVDAPDEATTEQAASTCKSSSVDRTDPAVHAALAGKVVRSAGETTTRWEGRTKISQAQFQVVDVDPVTGETTSAYVAGTTTCSTACSGSRCTTGGCVPSGTDCTACSCTGQYCLSECTCSKTVTETGSPSAHD